MATNDVPGANPRNNDVLHSECWAESSRHDGSYVKVDSVENGRVIYSIFDTDRPDPVEFRDAMSEDAFKRQFSWNDKNPSSTRWVWHDKQSFPWDIVIKQGAQPGVRSVTASDTLRRAGAIVDVLRDRIAGDDDTIESDAMRVARALGLAASELPVDSPGMKRAAEEIMRGIRRAARHLRK